MASSIVYSEGDCETDASLWLLRIASGGSISSGALKIWNFEKTRREIMTVVGLWGGTRHLEWLPDGNAIMVGAGDSILSVFRVPSKKEIRKTNSR